jgi:predicted acyltransferase
MADQSSSGRLLSLDVFRGATIAGMMLVNNPGNWGNIYAPWKHKAWDGWTYTDTVFPFFLWIVGVAMMLSFAKRMERGENKGMMAWHVLWRAGVIFFLGLFLGGVPHLSLFFFWVAGLVYLLVLLRRAIVPRSGEPVLPMSRVYLLALAGFALAFLPAILPIVQTAGLHTIRIPGVLQRIAVCYLITGLLVLYTSTRLQVGITFALLAFYWIVIKTVSVPGFGVGIWEAQGNLAWYIDANLLKGHTWRGAPVPGFDPEGIFSTIPAIATAMFGVFTGAWLRTVNAKEVKVAWMFVAGNLMLLVGLIMDNWLPINKPLWTSTYAVFMTGLALNVLACCYWILDVKGWKGWEKPFAIYGQNAITMFVLSGVFGRLFGMKLFGFEISFKGWYYENLFTKVFADPMMASFAHSISFMLFLYGIAYIMYRKNWIIKV